MPFQTGIITALKDWGLNVVEVPGWRTCGSQDFHPRGHVCHHDVVPDQPGTSDHIPSIIVNGRPDLPGPLANFWLETDGDVHLCAAGRANHAGEGGWNGLSGNSSVWGTEANNLGVPSDTWPDVQLDAWYKLCAATCDFSGFPPANVCGHKEWAPTRKIDPHTLNMATFRARVAAATKGGGFSIVDEATRNYFDDKFEKIRARDLISLKREARALDLLLLVRKAQKAGKTELDGIEADLAEIKADIAAAE